MACKLFANTKNWSFFTNIDDLNVVALILRAMPVGVINLLTNRTDIQTHYLKPKRIAFVQC